VVGTRGRAGAVGLAAIVALGCASAGSGSGGRVVAPTGKVYERGTPPEDTRYSQTAVLYLRRERPRRARELAREGVSRDPGNPIHYYLAGLAHARLGEYRSADSMFVRAEEIYPAYELEVEPARRAAWARAFNEGTDAYAAGDVDRAIDAWRSATILYDLRPRAHRTLADVLVGRGRHREAIETYRKALEGLGRRPATRVLEQGEVREREEARARIEGRLARLLVREGRYAEAEPLLRRRLAEDSTSLDLRSDLALVLDRLGRGVEADELYASILAERDLGSSRLFSLGSLFFRSGDYGRAVEAFGRLTRRQPRSRDAWYNYVNALFAAEEWARITSVGDRLLDVDPLGENAGLIVARAHLEAGDEAAARRLVERVDAAPVYLEGLELQRSGAVSVVRGRVAGNGAEPGSVVRLRFVFYGPEGRLGRRTVSLEVPSPDAMSRFEVSVEGRAEAYRYELIDPPPPTLCDRSRVLSNSLASTAFRRASSRVTIPSSTSSTRASLSVCIPS